MKLHEALRKIIGQYGSAVMQNGTHLLSLLAGAHAFDDYPAMKQVMGAVFNGRYGRELYTRAADADRGDYQLYAEYLRKSLMQILHFREEFASYAVDSISFAIGLCDYVTEPQEHGYEPRQRDTGGIEGHVSGSTGRQQSNAELSGVNDRRALSHQASAADSGSADEQFMKGQMYYFGQGVRNDYEMAAELFKKAAGHGHAGAEYCLGQMYLLGQGVRQDNDEALKWYRLAAAGGNIRAREKLANLEILARNAKTEEDKSASEAGNAKGPEHPANSEPAAGNARTEEGQGAAEAGNAKGPEHPANPEHASVNARAEEGGHAPEAGNAGTQGKPANQNTAADNSIKETGRTSTETLNAEALYQKAEKYYYGNGLRQDYADAAKFYRMAAEQGHAQAQNSLGFMYSWGLGVKQDNSEAQKWYRLAAAGGIAIARERLDRLQAAAGRTAQTGTEHSTAGNESADELYRKGRMYYYGQGVNLNYEEAAKWYRKAAWLGHVDAENCLGTMYSLGQGVRQDNEEALKWYRLAAAGGNVKAGEKAAALEEAAASRQRTRVELYQKAENYYYGHGARLDYAEAAEWYRKAAELGSADAQYSLGDMYQFGQGVRQSYRDAANWFRKAAAQGNAKARKRLENIMPFLSAGE